MRSRSLSNGVNSIIIAGAIVLLGGMSNVCLAQSSPRTILAVFAHPDDDITIGPLLAHYAKPGVRVYLAIVTSGQRGITAHAAIPAGDELAAVREAEARAACLAYGIEEPFLLREQDATLGSMDRRDAIVSRLREIIGQIKPSVIITWGADGLTGHADHRAVGNLVTEIFQMWGARDYAPQKLYYVAYPSSKFNRTIPPFPKPVLSVDDEFITTVVMARDGLAAASKAEAAYKSQHTPQVMKEVDAMMADVLGGNIYLRLALSKVGAPSRRESDIFERVR